MLPDFIITDIDGVWTDGSFYYSENGYEGKYFNTKDSIGVRLCQIMNIPLVILSTEKNNATIKRAFKLGIEYVFCGIENKFDYLNDFLSRHNSSIARIAYIGDEVNDYHIIKNALLSACPVDSNVRIKAIVTKVLTKKGGEGVFTEFVEYVFEGSKIIDQAYSILLDEIKFNGRHKDRK